MAAKKAANNDGPAGPSVVPKYEGNKSMPQVKFRRWAIPLTTEEDLGLQRVVEEYAGRRGVLYGFVKSLLGSAAPLISCDGCTACHSVGVELIAGERDRQVLEKGFDAARDDADLAGLWSGALAFLIASGNRTAVHAWPAHWSGEMLPAPAAPDDTEAQIDALKKAGALMAAVIDGLLRASAKPVVSENAALEATNGDSVESVDRSALAGLALASLDRDESPCGCCTNGETR